MDLRRYPLSFPKRPAPPYLSVSVDSTEGRSEDPDQLPGSSLSFEKRLLCRVTQWTGGEIQLIACMPWNGLFIY